MSVYHSIQLTTVRDSSHSVILCKLWTFYRFTWWKKVGCAPAALHLWSVLVKVNSCESCKVGKAYWINLAKHTGLPKSLSHVMCSIAPCWFGFRCTYPPARDRSWFSTWPWPVTGRSFSDISQRASHFYTHAAPTPQRDELRERKLNIYCYLPQKVWICLSLPEQSPDKHRAEKRQGRYSSWRQDVLWSVASVFFLENWR